MVFLELNSAELDEIKDFKSSNIIPARLTNENDKMVFRRRCKSFEV